MDKDLSPTTDSKIMTVASKGHCFGRRKKNSTNTSQFSSSSTERSSFLSAVAPPKGKRALLCCISYKNQKCELKGTIHDMKIMRDLLVKQFGFPTHSILILAEKEPYLPPTRKNMEDAFQWLVRDIQSGDSLVFYFSGHGLRQRGLHGDEIDGFDETICPVDFQANGMIFDNYINKTIVRPLTLGVTLHAIVDCCHSGTVLDLPRAYNISTGEWDDHRPLSSESKGTSGGKAICISACEDYQQAADTSAFSTNNEMNGAMTSTFIRAVEGAAANNQKITYRGILDHMHLSLKQEDKEGCVGGGVRRVFRRKILQDPMLSSSEEFDIRTEFNL